VSYAGPEFDPPLPRRSPLRRTLAVALAALVPGALLGWLAYETLGGPGDGGPGRATGAQGP
jgi:N-acetylmuramoyl-L-alanine amidase